MLKRVGESRHPCRTPTVEPVSYAAVEKDGTSGLVIEVFDDLDKVCADVLLHGCPQSCISGFIPLSCFTAEGLPGRGKGGGGRRWLVRKLPPEGNTAMLPSRLM